MRFKTIFSMIKRQKLCICVSVKVLFFSFYKWKYYHTLRVRVKNHESFDEFSIANWQPIEYVLGNDWKAENNLLRMLSHENLNEFRIGNLTDFLVVFFFFKKK